MPLIKCFLFLVETGTAMAFMRSSTGTLGSYQPPSCRDFSCPTRRGNLPYVLHATTDQYPSQQRKYTRSKGLSRDEEVLYSRQITKASRISFQTSATSHEIARVIENGQTAREALVEANIGLVRSIAKRYRSVCIGSILSFQDLVQEGHIGLMEAAARYQPEKGFRFSTYATWWIRQRILRSITDSSRVIRLPAHMQSTLQRIQKMKKVLTANLGREPTMSELAAPLGIPEDQLLKFLKYRRNVISLEMLLRTPMSRDRQTFDEFLACDSPTPEDDVNSQYLKRDILEVVNQLSDEERTVILCRFGLQDGNPKNREETSKLLGFTRDRVRLLEARALNKLRNPKRNFRLKVYAVATGITSDERRQAVPEKSDEERRLWLF